MQDSAAAALKEDERLDSEDREGERASLRRAQASRAEPKVEADEERAARARR